MAMTTNARKSTKFSFSILSGLVAAVWFLCKNDFCWTTPIQMLFVAGGVSFMVAIFLFAGEK